MLDKFFLKDASPGVDPWITWIPAAFAEADNAGQCIRTIRSPHNQSSATVTLAWDIKTITVRIKGTTWQASLPPSLVPAQIIRSVMALALYAFLHSSFPTIFTVTLFNSGLAEPPWLVWPQPMQFFFLFINYFKRGKSAHVTSRLFQQPATDASDPTTSPNAEVGRQTGLTWKIIQIIKRFQASPFHSVWQVGLVWSKLCRCRWSWRYILDQFQINKCLYQNNLEL